MPYLLLLASRRVRADDDSSPASLPTIAGVRAPVRRGLLTISPWSGPWQLLPLASCRSGPESGMNRGRCPECKAMESAPWTSCQMQMGWAEGGQVSASSKVPRSGSTDPFGTVIKGVLGAKERPRQHGGFWLDTNPLTLLEEADRCPLRCQLLCCCRFKPPVFRMKLALFRQVYTSRAVCICPRAS